MLVGAQSISTDNEDVLLHQRIALGIGFFCLFFIEKTSELLAVPFYQMTLGVDPFLFSIALTIPIVVSAVLSPWVGRFSDNFNCRFGRRRPLIFVSAILLAILFGLKWMVPSHWQPLGQLFYFFLISIMFYTVALFYSVPLTSLSYEISKSESHRIRVMEANTYFIKLASFSSQWVYPLAAASIFGSVFIGIKVVGWGIGLAVFALLGVIPALFVKEKLVVNNQGDNVRPSLAIGVRQIFTNPMMRLVGVLVLTVVGGVAFAAKMDYYVIVYYMFSGDVAEGAFYKALLSSGYAVMAALYIPLISYLARRYGKLLALQIILLLSAIGGVAKWFVFSPGITWLLLLDPVLCAAIWSAMTIIIPTMVASASDQDTQHTGLQRQGSFAGMHHWIVTISVILTLLLSGASLNAIGFDAHNSGLQTSETLLRMKLILVLGTTIPSLFAFAAVERFKRIHQLK